jgi:hypothetical protein
MTFQSVFCSVCAQVLVFLGNDIVSCANRIVVGLQNGHWPSTLSYWKSSQSNWKSAIYDKLIRLVGKRSRPSNNMIIFVTGARKDARCNKRYRAAKRIRWNRNWHDKTFCYSSMSCLLKTMR